MIETGYAVSGSQVLTLTFARLRKLHGPDVVASVIRGQLEGSSSMRETKTPNRCG